MSKFNNLGLVLGIALKFLQQCGKRIKTKSQQVFGVNSFVCRSYMRKTGREGGLTPLSPHQIGLIIPATNSVNKRSCDARAPKVLFNSYCLKIASR